MNRLKLLAAGLAFVAIGYAADEPPAQAPVYELALVDLQGQKKVLGTLPNGALSPRVSPDGTRVAFELADAPPAAGQQQLTRIHVARLDEPLENRKALQLTIIAPTNVAPVWSPDGDFVAFQASGNSNDMLFYQRADGGIQPRYLVDGRAFEGWYKGGLMTFITLTGERDYGISTFDFHTKQRAKLIDLPGTEQHSARISPDHKWIAYVSTETGRPEVWIEPLPQNGTRHQATKQGGRHPQWAPDMSRIYFDDQGGQLHSLDLRVAGDNVTTGEARQLPIKGFVQGDARRQYDLTPDGKSFVMLYRLPGR